MDFNTLSGILSFSVAECVTNLNEIKENTLKKQKDIKIENYKNNQIFRMAVYLSCYGDSISLVSCCITDIDDDNDDEKEEKGKEILQTQVIHK